MLDILPSGHARRFWLGRVDDEDLPDDLTLPSDWPLLLAGGCNPPGNIRVREAAMALDAPIVHPGFSYQDVVEKQQQFIEYAEHAGISVAGSSGAPGDAPKYLLVRDKNNRWHPDGAIPDVEIRDHWLVKFPHQDERGSRRGIEVLRNESAYMRVAHAVGLLAEELIPDWDDNMLFVPRFDRVVTEDGVVRLGFESLLSACGIADYGIDRRHESFCRAIARHSSNPKVDLLEYVQRDILNFAMRNTDNHGRNQALLKFPDGGVRLSPLYDFAPMFYDSRGISRRTRWRREREMPGSSPDWGGIIDDLSTQLGCDRDELSFSLAEWSTEIQKLPETMRDSGVDDCIVERCVQSIQDVSKALNELGRRPVGNLPIPPVGSPSQA
jgi:serine/threonine-protein kinase HipA